MRTAVRSAVSYIIPLLLISVAAHAADKSQIITAKQGYHIVISAPTGQSIPTSPDFAAGLTTIYSNLSKYPLGTFWCCYAWLISGSDTSYGNVAVAMPFTPLANATVNAIGVGAGVFGGKNELTVSLNPSNGDLPGFPPLASFNVSTVSEGQCCQLSGAKNLSIPITEGLQYWVVVQATPNSDTEASWDYEDTNSAFGPYQPFANNDNPNGVWTLEAGFPSAFAVFGTNH